MCQNAKQNVLLIAQDALSSIQSVITILNPTWPGLAQYRADSTAAINSIESWTPGSDGSEAVEALDDLIADIALFPIPTEYQAVIVVALDGLKSVIVLIEDNETGTTQQAAQKVIARTTSSSGATVTGATVGAAQANPPDAPVTAHAKVAWEPPTKVYEGVRQYAVDWNKVVSKHDNLKPAKMRTPKKWGILP